MNKLTLINKYYTKESVIKMVTSYVLYYQVSLGSLAYETTQDPDETIAKLKELNLSLNPNEMLLSIVNIFLEKANDDNFETNFDSLLQQKAILHALNDFVSKDDDLLNKNIFVDYKQKEILENKFFNSQMKIQYLSEYAPMNNHYKNVITDDYIKNVKEIITANFL